MSDRPPVIGLVARASRLLWRRVPGIALCIASASLPFAAFAAPAGSTAAQATVTAENTSGESLQQVPATFGEPFRAGDIPRGDTVVAYLDGKALPTQTDVKALNRDGSMRHAVMTVLLPALAGRASRPLALRAVTAGSATGRNLTLADVLQSGFDASIDLDIAGQSWHLDARTLLQHAAAAHACKPYGRECSLWLDGPLVSEWIVGGPVVGAQGMPQPHVAAYFAVRAYGPAPVSRIRVDVIVENDWAYTPDPQNVAYTAKIQIGDKTAYSVDGLENYRQSRWHKTFWWGKPDPVYVRQDSRWLQATRAVPLYEDVAVSQQVLQDAMRRLPRDCGPMQRCDQTKRMSNVGAQAGIGPLPRWTSAFVIDPSHDAFAWMLANSDALGSYGIHYRDALTGQPISVEAHPCATLIKAAEVSPCTVPPHADDNFPTCKAQCKSPLGANEAHRPAPAYVAYLVTGDWYYLEELKFWADWVVFQQNPAYRDYATGLIVRTPLRGQAWALRTLGYAAYILPDDDPFKRYFNQVVENNIRWYNRTFTDNPAANKLHIITNGSIVYPNHGQPLTGIATWQASFFNWSVGNLKDLGFAGADKLLDWVSVFQVNLMTSPDFCWTLASKYELQVRDTRKSPFYDSLKDVYAHTFPEMRDVSCNSDRMAALLSGPKGYRYARNDMAGYPDSPVGFPANFQIGLAAAADSNVPDAWKAWQIFQGRLVKPDYGKAPQFAVLPRHAAK